MVQSSSISFYNNKDHIRQNGRPGIDKSREQGWTAFQKDYARLLHSPSFRQLQGKTQLFPGDDSDFFRNRLTHSLEVAQIAGGIARRINATDLSENEEKLDIDLVQFAAIAHDLGHPPFGHNGEFALDLLMHRHGGYEGNAQTLRILSCTEKKLVKHPQSEETVTDFGLNLTYRALASVLKYDRSIPSVRAKKPTRPTKGYYSADQDLIQRIKENVIPDYERFLESKKESDGMKMVFKTIECSIMDIADDIAYSTYDLEDTLHAGFVSPARILTALSEDSKIEADKKIIEVVLKKVNEALQVEGYEKATKVELSQIATDIFYGPFNPIGPFEDILKKSGFSNETRAAVKGGIILRVHNYERSYVEDSAIRTLFTAERIGNLIGSVEFELNKEFPQLSKVKLGREKLIEVEFLKHLNYELNILSPRLAVIEYRGKKIVEELFNAFVESDGKLLSEAWQEDYYRAKSVGNSESCRVVCDYVASLTDLHAAELHSRLFSDGQSIFKPL